MDLHSFKIIDFELVQKGMFVGDLERTLCDMLLENLIKNDVTIQLFLSDRHKGIRYFMRTKHLEIGHEFDFWHLSKSLIKKLKTLENTQMYTCGKRALIIMVVITDV